MIPESVVYVHDMTCPSCGFKASGYLQSLGDGTGVTTCPRCGTSIKQQLPAHYVAQIPPSDFHSPVHPHVHMSHYPGLYMQPKHAPRLDFADLVRIMFAPARACVSLYLSTNLQRALAIVVLFSILSTVASTLVTADMGEVLGYDTGDVLEVLLQSFVSWVVSLLAFLIFGVAAAVIARNIFGGRGERGATLTLLGYAYPAYVILSVLLLMIFTLGFEGLDMTEVQEWTDEELDQAVVAGGVLLLVVIVGIVWLIWIASRAISVANDISTGEGVLSGILAAIAAGIVYLVVGAVMRLPMGLSF